MSECVVDLPAGMEPWSRHIPDGLLLDRLCFEPGKTHAELLERVAATENLRAVIDARQVHDLAELVAAHNADDTLRCTQEETVRSVATQVAVTTGMSHGAALRRVEEALALTHRLPKILSAMSQARLNYQSARVIIEEFTGLADELLDEAQTQILERVEDRNHSQVRRSAKRIVARLDADALRVRTWQALAERAVGVDPEPDGMATFWARLPAAQAVTLYGLVDHYAQHAGGGPNDDRTMDARRADAFYDLLTHPELDVDHPDPTIAGRERKRARARERVHTEIRVTVPLSALTGASDQPADLSGYGPISPDVARDLAGDPSSVWRRLITDPITGALLDFGTTRYRPPLPLVEFVNARAATCSIPGCRQPAEDCDTDHHQPFDPITGTGPTSARNTGPLCRYHHRIKQLPGWSIVRNPDDSVTWTLPTGHRVTTPATEIGETHPPPATKPEKPDPPPY